MGTRHMPGSVRGSAGPALAMPCYLVTSSPAVVLAPLGSKDVNKLDMDRYY